VLSKDSQAYAPGLLGLNHGEHHATQQ